MRPSPGPDPVAGTVEARFVVVPFLPDHQPALGISSLIGVLKRHDIRSDAIYLNIECREQIGADLYQYIACRFPSLILGETLFARALWGDAAPVWADFYERFREEVAGVMHRSGVGRTQAAVYREIREGWASLAPVLREFYEDSPKLVNGWATRVLEDTPRVVGFTSTFQQNVASLAVAKEIRRRVPAEEVRILMGGANCEGDMGAALADNFPWIDHVLSGEAEHVIFDLVRGDDRALPRYVVGPVVDDMNELPLPDFDDYFEAVAGTTLEETANLAAESSRGCWWGEKAHCTFCGLNGTTMAFRSKRPQRFAGELRELIRRYGHRHFNMADNILDMEYLRSLFPEIVGRGEDFDFVYETKANLKKDQLELMAAAGVRKIQPGIESLSTPILGLMDKGTTRLQNVQMLKWCGELRLGVIWNLLYGFPQELPDEYAAMASLMPLLYHLPPPSGVCKVRLDRFSPYWQDPERYGIRNVRHYWSFGVAYAGLDPDQWDRVAYFFEYDHADGREPLSYAGGAVEVVNEWRARYAEKVTLEILPGTDRVLDTRRGEAVERALEADEKRLLRVLDRIRTPRGALAAIGRDADDETPINSERLQELLAAFVDREWVIAEDGKFLSVVVDRAEIQRVVRRKVNMQLEWLGFGAAPASNAEHPAR